MRCFTESRDNSTADEFWLLEHPPVFTLGLSGKREHLLDPGDIPVVQSDRGGQVTYHGPGQLIAYVMLDLQRLGFGVRRLVQALEQSIIDLLGEYGVMATRRQGAPGVYIDASKVAALGLRVRRGCTYHGLALNVAMDLEPFQRINPCGYPGLTVTQTSDHGLPGGVDVLGQSLLPHLLESLGYNNSQAIFADSHDTNP
jgi:lipoyl(octanoyl) transferase